MEVTTMSVEMTNKELANAVRERIAALQGQISLTETMLEEHEVTKKSLFSRMSVLHEDVAVLYSSDSMLGRQAQANAIEFAKQAGDQQRAKSLLTIFRHRTGSRLPSAD
jgi:phage shock protein A